MRVCRLAHSILMVSRKLVYVIMDGVAQLRKPAVDPRLKPPAVEPKLWYTEWWRGAS